MESLSTTSITLEELIATRHQTVRKLSHRAQQSDQFPGLRSGQKRGEGLEFEDLRQYTPGDDIRHIDWNVTARSGETYTRVYREEREHTTTVLLDLRPSMFTGSTVLKSVRAARLAATILWEASQAGDRCSVVTLSNDGLKTTRPKTGYRGVLSACELINDQFNSSRKQTDKPECNLTPLVDWINLPGPVRGTNIILSGFDSLGKTSWESGLRIAGIQRRTIAVMLLDSLETNTIPPGVYPYRTSKGSRRVRIADSSVQELQVHIAQQISRALERFQACSVPLIQLDPKASASDLIAALAQRSAI